MAVAAPVAIGLAVASAAASTYGAIEQNQAVSRQKKAARQAADVQKKQLIDQASVEQFKRKNQAEQVLGRLRVSAAEAGVDFSGSYGQLETQAQIDQAINNAIAQRSLDNNTRRVQSDLQSALAGLASHEQNVILSSFQGAIQGASTGLSIGSGIEGLSGAAAAPKLNDPVTSVGGSGGLPSYGGSAFA